MYKLFSICFLLLPTLLNATVVLEQNTLFYSGGINKKQNSQVAKLLNQHQDIHTLTITSGGGNIDLGMDLADLIAQYKLAVNIKDFCFSSCANYILLAGSPTRIEHNAIIGWHGDAASAKWLDSDIDTMVKDLKDPQKSQKWHELRGHYNKVIVKASQREHQLYKQYGVNHDLLTLGLEPHLRDSAIKKRARGWSYSKKALTFFGVKNIEFGQWQPRSVKRFPLLIIDEVN